MPTTPDEASRILAVVAEYLPPERARALLRRLDEEVGRHSPNKSVRDTLAMLRRLAEGVSDDTG